MVRYKPADLRKRFKTKKWVMSYNHLYALVDAKTKKVMYIENYGPSNGFFIEAWRYLHFPRTSSIVEKSYREGNNSIFIIKQGKAKLDLVPSFAPIGIQECRVKGKQVFITIAGLGGGGVSASFSRGMAEGVDEVEVIQEGGGENLGIARLKLPISHMLLIGVDDTDNESEGATYSLAHNIATDIAKKYKVDYLVHNNVQLYPHNPNKTRNCMATVIGFIYKSKVERENILKTFKSELKKHTFSKETAIAVYDGFDIPKELRDLSVKVKNEFISDIEMLKKTAIKNGVELHIITGEKGLIGAIGSLGYYDKPEEAVEITS